MIRTLDGSCHSSRLEALYISSGKFSCEQRVFRERLEIPTAERVAMHADCRCEEHICGPRLHLGG